MIKLQQPSFTEPADPHIYDDEPIVIHALPSKISKNLVLFIHGLTGHRYGYWGKIPQFLIEDLPDVDIGLYYYRTAWKRYRLFNSIDLEQEARVLADSLRRIRLYEAVILVGHSMGGLLAKGAIVDLINRGHQLTLKHVTGLVLLACPQLGSLRTPSVFKLFSRDGRALYPHNIAIQRIDATFNARLSINQMDNPLDKFSIPAWAIVAAEDFWVDALSAGIGIPETQKISVRGSHGSIIAPPNKTAASYESLRDWLETGFRPTKGAIDSDEEILMEDACADDVPNIRSLAVDFFGEGVTPIEVLVAFANAGGILKVVKRVITNGEDKRERFSGYFCAIPLSKNASYAVKAGTLRGGELTMAHVPAQNDVASALYIGAVAARDFYSRAIVLEGLRLYANNSSANGTSEILTRPLTQDGLRLVRKYRFRPLQGNGGTDEVYFLRS